MNFNSKNRPIIIYSQYHHGYVAKFPDKHMENPKSIEKWFEGFEAELREIMPKQIHPTVIQLIKEILGE